MLSTVEADDLWIADRNFCTTGFVYGIATRHAAFLLRQHAQTLHYELRGARRTIGRCPTGIPFELGIRLTEGNGGSMEVRRIAIEPKHPTRDGEQVANRSLIGKSVRVIGCQTGRSGFQRLDFFVRQRRARQ